MKGSTKAILAASAFTVAAAWIGARLDYPPQRIVRNIYNAGYDVFYREKAITALLTKSSACNHGDTTRLKTVLEKSDTHAMEYLSKRGVRVCFYSRLEEKARRENSNIIQGVYYPEGYLAIWDGRRFSPEAVINSLPEDFAKNFDYKETLTIPMQATRSTRHKGGMFWRHVESPSVDLYKSPFTP